MRRLLLIFLLLNPAVSHASNAFETCRDHFLHGRYSVAEPSCLQAADEGILDAQKWVAFMYTKGRGVPQDLDKAFFWTEKTARRGDANSQYLLGRCYQFGTGTEKDLAKALHWYRKSAGQGNINGLYAMGNLYRKGIGVTVNHMRAYACYRAAAEKGMYLAAQAMDNAGNSLTDEEKKIAGQISCPARDK
ncbi:tetratricopeptide repeat protein [Desulfomarina sp.]